MNTAELLLDYANRIKHTPGLLVVTNTNSSNQPVSTMLSATVLALRLRKHPLALRAQMEGWTMERIVMEMY